MNTTLTLLILLLACILWYFIFSFICWSLDPSEWNTFSRIVFVFILIIAIGYSLNEGNK